MISLRQGAKTFLFLIALAGVMLPFSGVLATDCSRVSCVSGDISSFGNTDLQHTGNNACGGSSYTPECNYICNNNGAGSSAPFACAPATVNTNTSATSIPMNESGTTSSGFESVNGISFPTNTGLPDPEGGVIQILENFFSWLLAIFFILSIGAFIISGIQYLIAAGDEDTVKIAKRNMKWSIVGVLVGMSGWIIMQAVGNALNANPFF